MASPLVLDRVDSSQLSDVVMVRQTNGSIRFHSQTLAAPKMLMATPRYKSPLDDDTIRFDTAETGKTDYGQTIRMPSTQTPFS